MMSKEAFRQWFLSEIGGRWGKCSFTAVQLGDWYDRLNRYDAATLTEAARRHFTSDEPSRPSLKAIYGYAQQWQAKQTPARQRLTVAAAGVPQTWMYIQCVGKDADGRGPVGWFVPILIWPFHREYTQAIYDKAAEQQRVMHQRSRGGVWEAVSNTTESDMRIRQWKLTGQWDRIEQQAEKIRADAEAFRAKQLAESRPDEGPAPSDDCPAGDLKN